MPPDPPIVLPPVPLQQQPDLLMLESRISTMENNQHLIKVQITDVKSDTAELLEVIKVVKTLLAVLLVIGNILKWIGAMALAVTAIWALFRGYEDGSPPYPPNHK